MRVQAKGARRAQACVRCAALSNGPYCDEHRPRNFDRTAPFWGGQHTTPAQRRQRQSILARDSHTCRYCGAYTNEVHHVDAQSRGGKDTEENQVACCGPCNLRLGADD